MADIIRLTADEVRSLGTQFANAAEETEQLLNNLGNSVESAASGWEGEAYDAFVEKYAEIKQQMQSVVEMYNNVNEMLNKVVDTIIETDINIANATRG